MNENENNNLFGQQQGFGQQQDFNQPQQGFGQQQDFNQPQQGFNQQQDFSQPQQGFNQQQDFSQPQQGFNQQQDFSQPQQSFNQQQDFSQPQQGFNQQQDFSQPQQGFNQQQDFSQPQQGFNQQQDFKQPQQGFNQQQDFSQPQQGFGIQQQDFNQPQQSFGIQPSYQSPVPGTPMNGGAIPNGNMQYQKPKKNKAGLVIAIIAALVVVAIVLVIYMISKGGLFGSKPEKMLQKGVENMTTEMTSYSTDIAEEIGLSELKELFEEEAAHTNVNFVVSSPEYDGIENIGIEVDAITDKKNKQAKYSLSFGQSGMDISLGDIIAADNKLFLSIPLLFEEVYSVDVTNLGEDFNASAWAEYFETELPQDYGFELFAKTTEDEYSTELTEIVEKYKDLTDDIVTYSINKEAKEINVNDELGSYTGITITYNKDELNELIKGFKDDFMDSEYYNAVLDQYSAMYSAEQATEYQDMYNEIWETILGIEFEQDFDINVYFDKNGRIVNICTNDMVEVSGTDVTGLSMDFTFKGAERTMDDIEGSLGIETEEGISTILVNRFGTSDEENYIEYIDVMFYDISEGNEVGFTYENFWDKEDNSFDMSISIDVDGEELYLDATGYYKDITSGESYTIQVDNATFGLDDTELLNMTGAIISETTDEEIEVPKDAIDILDMDKSEINSLIGGAGVY